MVRVALLFALTASASAAALASGVLLSVQPYGAGWWHTVARCVKLAVKQRHEPVTRCGWSGSGGQGGRFREVSGRQSERGHVHGQGRGGALSGRGVREHFAADAITC